MSVAAAERVLFTSGQIAARLGAELRGSPEVAITELANLDKAGPGSLSFVRDARNLAAWSAGRCGSALVSKAAAERAPADPGAGRALIVVPDADLGLIQVLAALEPRPHAPTGVHASAVVDPSATLGEGVSIGPQAVIGPGASIGAGTIVLGGAYIGVGVKVGARCLLHPRCVVLDRCTLGDQVILHSGAVIGADGFGYRPAPGGKGLIKIPHIGTVEVQSHVEIGANSTVDRAKFGATVVGMGTKIDNQVHVGHNCIIGRCCILCGRAAFSGSVTLGDGVMLGGSAGIADNRTIGAGASIGAGSGVMDNIPPGETWFGYPARPVTQSLRMFAALQQLPKAMTKVRRLLKQSGLDTD